MATSIGQVGPGLGGAGGDLPAVAAPVAVPAPAAVAKAATDGSGAEPSPGRNVPPGGKDWPGKPPEPTLHHAVDVINQFLKANAREFVFELDATTGQGRVTVVNPYTGDIVRQIPASHVLQLAQNISETGLSLPGLLVDDSV